MGWKIYDEKVEMVARWYQYLPRIFQWQGRRYNVKSVERTWTRSGSSWRRGVDRRFFLVHCREGTFELWQDLKAGGWYLRRAKLVPNKAVVRRVIPVLR